MWVIIGAAAAFIGGTRVRTPFDTVMIIVSIATYLALYQWLKAKWLSRESGTEP